MQVIEPKAHDQAIPRGMRCKVCDHESASAINTLLASASLSNRRIASQFGFSEAAVRRHKENHIPVKLARAAERKQAKTEDVFMERHEHLYREALQYVEDAKSAVKMQKVTEETETDSGIKLQDRYQPFRDVGAMAPALTAATALQRVLGDATARFSQAAAGTGNVQVLVVMPRANELPVIEARVLPPAEQLILEGDTTDE